MPTQVTERAARRFIEEKSDWIRTAVSRIHSAVPVAIGAEVPVAGHPCRVVHGRGRAAVLNAGQIEAPPGREGPAIEALIKHLARDRLSVAVDRFAAVLKEQPGRLTLRDTRSRWGSCTSDGNLMFSWRLALAPSDVLDYVAAHEVAHLKHMDHSAAFWRTVDSLYPSYQSPRDWLRKEGAGLHRYRFRASTP